MCRFLLIIILGTSEESVLCACLLCIQFSILFNIYIYCVSSSMPLRASCPVCIYNSALKAKVVHSMLQRVKFSSLFLRHILATLGQYHGELVYISRYVFVLVYLVSLQ